jgi:hypothetical protein
MLHTVPSTWTSTCTAVLLCGTIRCVNIPVQLLVQAGEVMKQLQKVVAAAHEPQEKGGKLGLHRYPFQQRLQCWQRRMQVQRAVSDSGPTCYTPQKYSILRRCTTVLG